MNRIATKTCCECHLPIRGPGYLDRKFMLRCDECHEASIRTETRVLVYQEDWLEKPQRDRGEVFRDQLRATW